MIRWSCWPPATILPQRESEHVVTLIQRRVDGLILAPSDAADMRSAEACRIPGRLLRPAVSRQCRLHRAQRQLRRRKDGHGAPAAAAGANAFSAWRGDSKLFTSQHRVRGYRDVVKAAGLPCIAELEVNDLDGVREALRRHLAGRDKIDGVFSIKNALTVHAYKVLRELGVPIPGKVSLLGFDDFELADALDPPITVVRQPVVGIATRAAELLFEVMSTRHEKQRTVTMKLELVLRGSCRENRRRQTDSVFAKHADAKGSERSCP